MEDIRKDLPLRLWYGKYDTNVPANHGIQIAKRLGDAGGNVQLRIEEETHMTLVLKRRKEILEDLLGSM